MPPQVPITVIFTVFKSAANIPPLLVALSEFIQGTRQLEFEVIFVVDGCPDGSFELLRNQDFSAFPASVKIVNLTRNFGAPYALRCGLDHAGGEYVTGFACDLQEPFSFITDAIEKLNLLEADICFGLRSTREDPLRTRVQSNTFWYFYRRFINGKIPKGGADLFLARRKVIESIKSCREKTQFLVGLFFWLGHRHCFLEYKRSKRKIGKSSWSFRKRISYFFDSVFAYTNLPVKGLTVLGMLGLAFAVIYSSFVIYARLINDIPVPGYAAIVTLISFFGGLNCIGFGILGEYIWRNYKQAIDRPLYVVDKIIGGSDVKSR